MVDTYGKHRLFVGVMLVLLFSVTCPEIISPSSFVSAQQRASQAPGFQVDPFWPKPLPNHWVLGSVTGVTVDRNDHIWIVHRGADSLGNNEKGGILNPPTGCCVPAPPVLEFDQAGNLLAHWGGPGTGYDWPQTTGAITVDHKGNVWIAGAGQDPSATPPRAATTQAPRKQDAHVLKFSPTGKLLLQIGQAGKVESHESQSGLNRPSSVTVDGSSNEVYVADTGNRRVVVFDADTGAYKRHWGAYGDKPDGTTPGAYDPSSPNATQFRAVTSTAVATDGSVYVADRSSNRIQVFKKDGKFVKEAYVSKSTLGDGSVWGIALSQDPTQRLIYIADGQDKRILVLRRDTLEMAGSFGDGGRMPGQFYAVCNIAVDRKGNVYTAETSEGKRVQKFVSKAAPASSRKTR